MSRINIVRTLRSAHARRIALSGSSRGKLKLALAELDRAKTTFFSNISHEFRTPLTLMLGPLDDLLQQPQELAATTRVQLEMIYGNGLRLLKLVNTLLDFSQLQEGRMQAHYEPIDLAAYTTELTGVFRSAIERAGLQLPALLH